MIDDFEYECICQPAPDYGQAHSVGCVFTNRMRAEAEAEPGETPLIATVPEGAMRAWRDVARFHPKTGNPGLSYETVDPGPEWGGGPDGGRIEMILHRNHKGRLTGVLYYYPVDFRGPGGQVFQRWGTVNVWVDPARWGRGVGTKLAMEANRRWPEGDLSRLDLTEGGLALARKVVACRASSEPVAEDRTLS